MSCCPPCCPCCCFSIDQEKQWFGVTCCHYECGCCPPMCCKYDYNGLCWGFTCCEIEVDPCWCGRGFLECFCGLIPCGCIAKETIECICCCNPGRQQDDPAETQKKVDAKVKEELEKKNNAELQEKNNAKTMV